jgi:hypothetical protein
MAVGAALVVVLGLAPASEASGAKPVPNDQRSAASCYAASCNAKDPQAQGCNPSAVTLEEFTVAGYRLELRYSSACHAAWVRAHSAGNWNHQNRFKLERQSPSSYFSTSFASGETGTKWTKMYSFTYYLRGSLYVLNISSGDPNGTWYTDWY